MGILIPSFMSWSVLLGCSAPFHEADDSAVRIKAAATRNLFIDQMYTFKQLVLGVYKGRKSAQNQYDISHERI